MRARWRLPSAASQNGRLTRSANKNMPRIGQHYRPNNSATKNRPTKCVQRKSSQKHRPNISAKTFGLKFWPNNSAKHFGQTFGLPPSTHRKSMTRNWLTCLGTRHKHMMNEARAICCLLSTSIKSTYPVHGQSTHEFSLQCC